MRARLDAVVVLSVALLTPGAALAGGTIEGFYGVANPPGTSFHSSLGAISRNPDIFNGAQQIGGGDVMFNIGWIQFGAIADHTWASGKASQTAVGGLLGVKLPLGPFRFDLMGEGGGHRYGDLGTEVNSGRSEWLAYVGFRPGVAYKFGAQGQPGLILGLWGFARWDLNTDRVQVTAENVGNVPVGSLKLGGTTIGGTLRLGFEF